MTKPTTAAALWLLLVPGAVARFPTDGEWACFRRDGSQQAHSPLKGSLHRPTIAWKHYIGVVSTLVELRPSGSGGSVTVPHQARGDPASVRGDARWGLRPPTGPIAGRPQPIQRSTTLTYADTDPACPGLERILFESGFRGSGAGGQWPTSAAEAAGWRQGAWHTLWRMPPRASVFTPNPIVADFDADGELEIAFLPWRDLVVLNARSGAEEASCRFTKGRSYGFFGVYDLDGNGTLEFVVLADFAKHMDVLGYRDGRLALLWQQEIELDISNPQTTMRVHPDPVADVDGDGDLEVVVSLHKRHGDGRWHTLVYDGMTGALRGDLPDQLLRGIVDVDDDGAADLLTVATNGIGVPEHGPLSVWGLRNTPPRAIWHAPSAAWQTWQRPMPEHVNTQATDGRRDVLWRTVRGRSVVVTRQLESGGGVVVTARTWRDGALRAVAAVRGHELRALALAEDGALLVASRTAPDVTADIQVSAGTPKLLVSYDETAFFSPPAVLQEEGSSAPTVVVQGGGEQLLAVHPPRPGQAAVERWRVRGRGQSEDWHGQLSRLGPVVADLHGDGRRQVIYATAAPGGCARLVAMDSGSEPFWHHDFPGTPGPPPPWNVGGLILWQAGRFTHSRRMDVLVTIRRSMMHSEETVLLSGRDGRELWRRDRSISNRGVGGVPFALADCNGDGLDDAISLHPNVHYALSGPTGETVTGKVVEYWGLPVVGDFLNDGGTSLFFATTRASLTSVLRLDGTEVWSDARGQSGVCRPAVGCFSGSGRAEIVGFGYPNGIRCYDAATGKVRWRMSSPASGRPAGTASADTDGDGRDEALVVIGSSLYCIGADDSGSAGVLEWEQRFPRAVGPPTVADTDGDGEAEILVVGRDAVLYCVDGEGQE